MFEGRQNSSFTTKTLNDFFIGGKLGVEEFDSGVFAKVDVLRQIHNSHPTHADPLDKLVVSHTTIEQRISSCFDQGAAMIAKLAIIWIRGVAFWADDVWHPGTSVLLVTFIGAGVFQQSC